MRDFFPLFVVFIMMLQFFPLLNRCSSISLMVNTGNPFKLFPHSILLLSILLLSFNIIISSSIFCKSKCVIRSSRHFPCQSRFHAVQNITSSIVGSVYCFFSYSSAFDVLSMKKFVINFKVSYFGINLFVDPILRQNSITSHTTSFYTISLSFFTYINIFFYIRSMNCKRRENTLIFLAS